MHPFSWNFVHKKSGHTDTLTDTTDTHIDRQTYTKTNLSENITPPRFQGGVKNKGEEKILSKGSTEI